MLLVKHSGIMEICKARKQEAVSALVARIRAKARAFVAARSPRPSGASQHSPRSGKAKRRYKRKDSSKDPLVYKLTNMVNGKGYVGKAEDSHARMREHEKRGSQQMPRGKKTQAIDQAIYKYGWENFKVEWLETNIAGGRAKLLEREGFHMRKHNTMAPNGYNILKPGVEVVSMHDPEVRARWELRNPEGTKKAVATLTAKREAKLADMGEEDAAKLSKRLEMGRVREKRRHAGEEMPPDGRWSEETNKKKSKMWEERRAAKVALMTPEEAAKFMKRYEWAKKAEANRKEKRKQERKSEASKAYQKEYKKRNAHKVLRLG